MGLFGCLPFSDVGALSFCSGHPVAASGAGKTSIFSTRNTSPTAESSQGFGKMVMCSVLMVGAFFLIFPYRKTVCVVSFEAIGRYSAKMGQVSKAFRHISWWSLVP